MLSSYTTEDNKENLSIKYENIYSIDGELYFFTTNKNENLPFVNKWTNVYVWRPKIKLFENELEITQYLQTFQEKEVVELAALSDNIWFGNIGHALWDGLYPIYLALVKFEYIKEDFLLLSSDWGNKESMSYGITTVFTGNESIGYSQLNKSKLIYFKILIAGTGRVGNRVVNEDVKLYGEKYNGIQLFKERMLNNYNITIDNPINEKLKIIIINNKRFSEYERNVIREIVDHYKHVYNIKFIDWYHDYKSFAEQLKELENTDLHITGPGTGMLYMPFLKRGAVNVNLGNMERTQTNPGRPNLIIKDTNKEDFILPGFIEQNVCAGANYINTLYYDRYTYNNLEFKPLISIIDKAISVINEKKILNNNLNIDALIFKEYCKMVDNSKQICDHLTNLALCIEFFVNEHPAVMNNLVNIKLLRKIKDEFKYDRKYEIKI